MNLTSVVALGDEEGWWTPKASLPLIKHKSEKLPTNLLAATSFKSQMSAENNVNVDTPS